MERAAHARERLDEALPAGDLAATFDDLDFLNTWFGGHALVLGAVRRAAARASRARSLVVVDVGGGRGDFARRVTQWARRARRKVVVVVVDRDPATLALGRAATAGETRITLVRADAAALPFRAAAADVVTTSLTIHHLQPAEASAAMREMAAAGRTVVVNDLIRSRASLAIVWLATRLLPLHPVSRHDGLVSVKRAYSGDELIALASRVGLRLRVRRYRWLGRLLAEADGLGDSARREERAA